jgi:hypothetical protein
VLELIEVTIDVGADPPNRLAVTPGQEVLGLGMLEEWVPFAVEEPHPL